MRLRAAMTTLLLCVASTAGAGVLGKAPDVLVCSVNDPTQVLPWDQLVFYVSARIEGGGTLYKSLTSNPVLVTIGVDGIVRAPNLADCDGKEVQVLRRSGRARDFAR